MMHKERKQGAGDRIVSLLFIFAAFAAVFLVTHKQELVEGRIVETVQAYVTEE